jgi:SAM-dependent methyltransferase
MRLFEDLSVRCVECGGVLEGPLCRACGRLYEEVEGVPVLLSNEDANSPLFRRYLENYDQIASDDLEQDILQVFYKRAQTEKLVRYCGDAIRGRVLDIGCGQGDFLRRVPHADRLGVDIALPYLSRLRAEGIPVALANSENLPFASGFDLIVVTDILEHVLSPERALRCIVRAARPGAKVVIRVPYKEDLSSYAPEAGCRYEFVHLRSFDEHSLDKMLVASGLHPIALHYDGWSFSRFREGPGPAGRILAGLARWYHERVLLGWRRLDTASASVRCARWPNAVARRIFEPIEIAVVAEPVGSGAGGVA